MKIRISGVKPEIESIPEVVEELEPVLEEEPIEDTEELDEEDIEEAEDEEESDADFQYNNFGIYFKNGTEIRFNTENEEISVASIIFPNSVELIFDCDELGNLKEVKNTDGEVLFSV